jgi:CYTH domain-containing protein
LRGRFDEFSGDNFGLVIAENQLPLWIGPEITGRTQYYNGILAQSPFGS